MRDTLAALIERVEQATGPDRCIDAGVFAALHPELRRLPREPNAFIGPDEWIKTPPFYTASLDAAVSLVPDGMCWTVALRSTPLGERTAEGFVHNNKLHMTGQRVGFNVFAATPALALCAAALRARMESER